MTVSCQGFSDKYSLGLPMGRSEQVGREIAIQLHRGNWEAAKSVVDKAELSARKLIGTDRLDLSLEEVGVDPKTASLFAKAGYYCGRDLLGVTSQAMTRLKSVNKRRAAQITQLVSRLAAGDKARRRMVAATPDQEMRVGCEDEFGYESEEV